LKKWLLASLALGVAALVAGYAGQAMADVTITESMDHVLSDSYSGQHTDPDPPNMWDVVRFDVTNNSGLGVYGVMIGAKPGGYDWSSYSEPAMLFGNPWEPVGATRDSDGNLPYLPQKDNQAIGGIGGINELNGCNGSNCDGTIDWSTSLFEVRRSTTTGQYYAYDPYNGTALPFALPSSFQDYGYVYWFETVGPFIACSGDYCGDSVPIQDGQTFSFFVTGGLGSPFVYLTQDDYDESTGSLKGAYTGSGVTQHGVPEPATMLLMFTGLAAVACVRLKKR
jgi:hypothetical protein